MIGAVKGNVNGIVKRKCKGIVNRRFTRNVQRRRKGTSKRKLTELLNGSLKKLSKEMQRSCRKKVKRIFLKEN